MSPELPPPTRQHTTVLPPTLPLSSKCSVPDAKLDRVVFEKRGIFRKIGRSSCVTYVSSSRKRFLLFLSFLHSQYFVINTTHTPNITNGAKNPAIPIQISIPQSILVRKWVAAFVVMVHLIAQIVVVKK